MAGYSVREPAGAARGLGRWAGGGIPDATAGHYPPASLACAFVLVARNPFFDGLFRARLPNPTYGKGGLMWASLTLALLTLPVVIVSTRETLQAVPQSFRMACWSLGATRWQTIRKVVLPNSISGILTGVILEVSRTVGETAPVMFTGAVLFTPFLPQGVWAARYNLL